MDNIGRTDYIVFPRPIFRIFLKEYGTHGTYRTHYGQMSQATFFEKISQLQKPILCLSNFDFFVYFHLRVVGAVYNM